MRLNEFFEQILFSVRNHDVTVGHLTAFLLVVVITFLLYRLVVKRGMPLYFQQEKFKTRDRNKVVRGMRFVFILFGLIGSVWCLQLDYPIYEMDNFTVSVSTILYVFFIFQLASLLDWVASKLLMYNYYRSRRDTDDIAVVEKRFKDGKAGKPGSMVRLVVYAMAAFIVLQIFGSEEPIFNNKYDTTLSDIFEAILILLGARLLIWILTQVVLYTYYQRSEVNTGARYAINQLLKYIIYTLAVLMAISSLGIQMNVLLGGTAALLVGLGLGLQQTFNDFFSGIILLFERTVEVGDVLEIGTLIGTVKEIGLRASIIETRDSITVVVPNSKLVTDNVINWNHYDDKVRFNVSVGVAYGSDTKLVKDLLLKVAKENVYVNEQPSPFVRFTNFGDSSLDFELHFFSRNHITIEDIKSDLRFSIDQIFRENNIEIPFPQRVVWMQKD